MAQYLSPEWFVEMEAAAATFVIEGADDKHVALRETITGTPFGDVSYVMVINGGHISFSNDLELVAAVEFTQDYETASALHRSELTTQEAFFAGRVRVAGHLNTLLENSDALQGVAPAFNDVRAATTY